MKSHRLAVGVVAACCVITLGVGGLYSEGKKPSATVQVHLVITDQALNNDREAAVLRQDNVKLKLGKEDAQVAHVIPALGDSAALQLFFLIDDTCEPTALGSNLNDLRDFIAAQPPSTAIGIG